MREPSLADMFVEVMAEIAAIEAGIDNDHPHRHAFRRLRQTADVQLAEAMRNAVSIAEVARMLRRDLTIHGEQEARG